MADTNVRNSTQDSGRLSYRQIMVILSGLMLGMFLASLDQTIVSTAMRTIADKLNGQTNQAWALTSSRQLTVYGTMCLDAAGSGNGAAVQIYSCHSQTNQQWNVNSNGTISNVQSGRCLDAWSTSNGAQIQLYDCHGQTNQQFRLAPLA